ncbi:MAG: hypothetical protein ACPKPY_10685 [Nitrososphaeraceae archaeon]
MILTYNPNGHMHTCMSQVQIVQHRDMANKYSSQETHRLRYNQTVDY